MKKAEKVVVGDWRITSMEMWDADYFDMEVPAHAASTCTRVTIRTSRRSAGAVSEPPQARSSSLPGY